MNPSLQLRNISRKHLIACNALYRSPIVFKTHWLSSQWEWTIRQTTTPEKLPIHIVASWGSATVIIRGSTVWLERLNAYLAGDAGIRSLPEQLQVALAEAVFSEIVEQIEFLGKRPLRIESIQIDKVALSIDDEFEQMHGLEWQAVCNSFLYSGELWLNHDGIEQAAELSRSRKSQRRSGEKWIEFPIPIRFLVGQTALSSRVYRSLELSDVVLFDECWLSEDRILTASLGSGIAFRGRIDGACLIVVEGLGKTMDDPAYDEQLDLDTEGDSLVRDIPIKLTFDLGERTMQIGELQSLQPGYVFDLGRDLRKAVIIRANGICIGEGELVDISGRTGVALLSLLGKHG